MTRHFRRKGGYHGFYDVTQNNRTTYYQDRKMATFATRNPSNQNRLFSPAIFNFDHIEPHVQTHLKNVYSSLSIGMLAAAAGAYFHVITGMGQMYLLTSLASIGLMLWLYSTRSTKEETNKRLAIFGGFTFTSGISLGPLLQMAVHIEPSIISTALAGTAVVFISFTMAALLSRNRSFLYMGGFLMTALGWLTLAGILNIFFGSRLIFDVYIYGILGIFSAFVLYDTQLIIEKRRMGDDDFIWHSVDLFLDAIQIFRALLVILSKKEDDRRRRRD